MTALPNLKARLRNCRGVLVDSNILLDVATGDPSWVEWSESALGECADRAALVINPIVYAEVSVAYETIEELDAALPIDAYAREPLPWEAGFLAGKCFLTYRRRGGTRNTPLGVVLFSAGAYPGLPSPKYQLRLVFANRTKL